MTFNPDWVSPPGDTIKEVLRERNISYAQFAKSINLSEDLVLELIEGKLNITEDLAESLSNTLGASKKFWLKREKTYRAGLHGK